MLNPAMPVLLSVQFRATLWATVPPVPVKDEVGLFEALLTKLNVAEAVPDIWGANVRVTGTLCPGLSVAGRGKPMMENPEPVTVACDRLTPTSANFGTVTIGSTSAQSGTISASAVSYTHLTLPTILLV